MHQKNPLWNTPVFILLHLIEPYIAKDAHFLFGCLVTAQKGILLLLFKRADFPNWTKRFIRADASPERLAGATPDFTPQIGLILEINSVVHNL